MDYSGKTGKNKSKSKLIGNNSDLLLISLFFSLKLFKIEFLKNINI